MSADAKILSNKVGHSASKENKSLGKIKEHVELIAALVCGLFILRWLAVQ